MQNKSFVLTPSSFDFNLNPGSSNSSILEINNTGNVNLTGVRLNCSSGDLCVNFNFSAAFDAAIELKVTADQNALAAENNLKKVKFEADQAIATAKGQAEAIRIQAEAINSQGGADYVQLQAISKWNGDVPTYMMGNSVPFINLGK